MNSIDNHNVDILNKNTHINYVFAIPLRFSEPQVKFNVSFNVFTEDLPFKLAVSKKASRTPNLYYRKLFNENWTMRASTVLLNTPAWCLPIDAVIQ